MKRSLSISSSAFLALVAAFAGVAPLQALTVPCQTKTIGEAYADADAIFLGRVVKTVEMESEVTGFMPANQYVTLELYATWKTEGETFENRRVEVQTLGPDVCLPTYVIGQTWLVYAQNSDCEALDPSLPCSPYSNGDMDGAQMVAYHYSFSPESLPWLESLGEPDQVFDETNAMAGLSAAFPLYRGESEYMAPPFGKFRVNQAPWYKWDGNGWVYIAEFTNGGFWWYDQSANRWFFTDESTYPWLYTEGFDWIALDTAATSPNARWAYVTKYDQWMKLSALNAFEAPAVE
ncbi:MAG: hypothetical protein Q7P63_12720 [Verrucomicrobiota bacterium JB022]|nr:hypothetical protein [Verrucomicrobiota bacterium JB022]